MAHYATLPSANTDRRSVSRKNTNDLAILTVAPSGEAAGLAVRAATEAVDSEGSKVMGVKG
jgi:hypothetical protein